MRVETERNLLAGVLMALVAEDLIGARRSALLFAAALVVLFVIRRMRPE